MAKKVLLQDQNNVEILPITRGELILDSSGKQAFHSNEFLATTSQPGLLSAEDKFKIDTIEEVGNIANNKVEQINTTTSDIYRLLFSETADDETRTEGARKSAKLTFNPSTGALQASALIGNIDGTYINKLTGYTKATLSSDITPEDTLISALGKVEFRAEIAYNLIQSAYDGDGTIENLNEILKVLEGISDTEPIKDIIGKYLPLIGGELSGNLSIGTNATEQQLLLSVSRNNEKLSMLISGAKEGWLSTNYESGKSTALIQNELSGILYKDTLDNYHNIIHSGNIENYLKEGLTEKVITDLNDAPSNCIFTMTDGYGSIDGNKPSYGWVSGITFRMSLNDDYQTQIATSEDGRMYFRAETNNTWGDWNKLAYITDLTWDNISNKPDISSIEPFEKILTVTKDWMDTGIRCTDLATGTYAVQVYVDIPSDIIYYGYWSGIMTWYADTTNGTRSDEILLHSAGHDISPNIYLRTIASTHTEGTHLRLQIAASKDLSTATYTFNFKKLI